MDQQALFRLPGSLSTKRWRHTHLIRAYVLLCRASRPAAREPAREASVEEAVELVRRDEGDRGRDAAEPEAREVGHALEEAGLGRHLGRGAEGRTGME